MNWTQYFEMMRDWKRLPAYKAEPRIDSVVGYYLPEILTDYCHDRITGIIPELPLRLAAIKPQHEGTTYADKSYKVDFYLLAESGKHYFVEFKTDSGSRRDEQDQYLDEAKAKGMGGIVDGISRIAAVSSFKAKYAHLLGKLATMGLINNDGVFTGQKDEIEVVYVQPRRKEADTRTLIDFVWISQWLTDKYPSSDFEAELARTLAAWAAD
jgi:hypothetical protein